MRGSVESSSEVFHRSVARKRFELFAESHREVHRHALGVEGFRVHSS